MRKMINFAPDPIDNGGAGPENNNRRDPAYSRVRNNRRPVEEREELRDTHEYFQDYESDEDGKIGRLGWRDLLSARAQERMKTIEKVVAGVITGSRVIKRIKGMSKRQKITAGALIVAGAAGATYLALRNRRRRFL